MNLLPVGFYDLVFEEAEKNHQNINKILDGFFAKNYRLIKTPLAEFAQNFSTEEIKNSFHLTDLISGKEMIVRSDITSQISRLLSTRLKQEKFPLKICYVGDVLCAKSNELYADRQQTQVGLEIIGCDEEKSDFEIIENLLSAIIDLGIKNPLIEFSFSGFLESFLKQNHIKNSSEIIDAISKKNLSKIHDLCPEKANEIIEIAMNNHLPSKHLPITIKILENLSKKFPEAQIRFDLFGDRNSSYHNGIYFDVFSKDFSYPIARGGRYKINEFDAVGATIYMNRIRKFS